MSIYLFFGSHAITKDNVLPSNHYCKINCLRVIRDPDCHVRIYFVNDQLTELDYVLLNVF